MKLILSTLALGTAAAAPMLQESGADAPHTTNRAEPLALPASQVGATELHTKNLPPAAWKLELATTEASAQQDDQKELEQAAQQLEAELARLRSELEALRGNLAKERGQAALLREVARNQAGDIQEASRSAIQASREAARAAQTKGREAQAEAIARAREIALKAGEATPEVAPDNVQKWTLNKLNLEAVKDGKQRRWEMKGLPKGEHFFQGGSGITRLGIAELTDVTEEADGHGGGGQGFIAPHGMHGADGSTINIHLEKGDVHIHANGASIHAGGHGQGPKTGLFGTTIGGDKKGKHRIFGLSSKGSAGAFDAKVINKFIVNGKEVDTSAFEAPEGFSFDVDGGSFSFSGKLDLEDITEELEDITEEISEEIVEAIGGAALGGLGYVGGIVNLEDAKGLAEIVEIDGRNFVFGEAFEGAPESIEVKTVVEDGKSKLRVFVNGKEIPNFGEFEAECIEEECEEDEEKDGEDRFVWFKGPGVPAPATPFAPSFPGNVATPGGPGVPAPAAPFAPSPQGSFPGRAPSPTAPARSFPGNLAAPAAPAAPGSPFPQLVNGHRLAAKPSFPSAAARSPRAAGDLELTELAREIREELRAMRAEIRELRAEVMRAPEAPKATRRGRRR